MVLACLGCAPDPAGPLVLVIGGPGAAEELRVWVKSEGPGGRRVQTPDGEPWTVPVPEGQDLAVVPFLLGVELGAGAPAGPLVVHVAAVAGDGLVATGAGRVEPSGDAGQHPLTLRGWRAGCDRDADGFSDCGLDGCCEHLPGSLREAVDDCIDDPEGLAALLAGEACPGDEDDAVGLARSAHPFRPASFDAAATLCGDCVDQDCVGGDAPCDEIPDRDGDGVAPPVDCDDGDPGRHPDAPETCNGVDDDCDGWTDEDLAPECLPGCRGTADCPSGVCDPEAGRCVPCVEDDDCGQGAWCQEAACLPGCRLAEQCPEGQRCSPEHACVECWEDEQCPPLGGATAICEEDRCREGCRGDAHCAHPAPRCSPAGQCVECLGPDDCGGHACADDGTCSVGPGCRGFGWSRYCEEGSDDGGAWCDLHVQRDLGTSCRLYCGVQGVGCVTSFRDGEEVCGHAERQSCDSWDRTQTCRCRAK